MYEALFLDHPFVMTFLLVISDENCDFDLVCLSLLGGMNPYGLFSANICPIFKCLIIIIFVHIFHIILQSFIFNHTFYFYVHFRTNTPGKGMNPLSSQRLNRTTTVLKEEWLWH